MKIYKKRYNQLNNNLFEVDVYYSETVCFSMLIEKHWLPSYLGGF